MIKELKITSTSGHAASFGSDGSDATRLTPGATTPGSDLIKTVALVLYDLQ
jgi:hypothetical protein